MEASSASDRALRRKGFAEPFSYAQNRYRRQTPAISGRATAARSDAA
jgi:hypothetical protein